MCRVTFIVGIIGLEVLKLNDPQENIEKSNPQDFLKLFMRKQEETVFKDSFHEETQLKLLEKGAFWCVFLKTGRWRKTEKVSLWRPCLTDLSYQGYWEQIVTAHSYHLVDQFSTYSFYCYNLKILVKRKKMTNFELIL